MKEPTAEDIIGFLLQLYAKQEHVRIKYEINGKQVTTK